jgi:hypothetical protein
MNSDMGFLTALTIFVALVVDFLFLPPLLMALDKRKNGPDTNTDKFVKTPAKSTIELT